MYGAFERIGSLGIARSNGPATRYAAPGERYRVAMRPVVAPSRAIETRRATEFGQAANEGRFEQATVA